MNAFHKWLFGLVWTCTAVWVSYEWLDRPIVLFFQQMLGRPELLAKLAQVPDLFVPLTVTAVLPLGLLSLFGRTLSRLGTCALLCSLSLVIAVITKSQLKFVFGRTWPSTWANDNPSFLHDGAYGFNFLHGGLQCASFPSGHAAMACAVIAVLWIYYPTWKVLYVLAVLAVAVGLVGANYHFLSDVIAGGFVGISSGWMITSLWAAHGCSRQRRR